MAVTSGSAKTVTILGCTGSIGESTVDLLAANPDRFRVLALVGNRNGEKLAAQAVCCRPPGRYARMRISPRR